MIQSQTSIMPNPFLHHLLKREAKKKFAKRNMAFGLMLTPLVDMFSLLVIFLLQFFSASPEFLITPGMQLPTTLSGIEIKQDIPMISLTKDEVLVERISIGKIDDVLKKPDAFADALTELRKVWQIKHPSDKMLGEINLEAHESLKSTVVSQYMGLLSAQHFGAIQLMTFSDAG